MASAPHPTPEAAARPVAVLESPSWPQLQQLTMAQQMVVTPVGVAPVAQGLQRQSGMLSLPTLASLPSVAVSQASPPSVAVRQVSLPSGPEASPTGPGPCQLEPSSPVPQQQLHIQKEPGSQQPVPCDAGKLTSVSGKGGAVVCMPPLSGSDDDLDSASEPWKEAARKVNAMRDNMAAKLREEMTATLRSFRTLIWDAMQQNRADIDDLKSWRTTAQEKIDSTGGFPAVLSARLDELERLSQQRFIGREDAQEQHRATEDQMAHLAKKLEACEEMRKQQDRHMEELQSHQASLETSVNNLEATCLRGPAATAMDGDAFKRIQDDVSALQRQRREVSASLAAKFDDLQELRESQACLKECMTTLEALGKRTLEEQEHHIRAVFDEVQHDVDEVRSQQKQLAEALERDTRCVCPEKTQSDQEALKSFDQDVKALQDALAKEIARVCNQQDDFRQDMEQQQRTDLAFVQKQIASDMDLMRAKWQNEVELLRCMCSRASESIEALWRSKGNSHGNGKAKILPDLRDSLLCRDEPAPGAATTEIAVKPTMTARMIAPLASKEDCTVEEVFLERGAGQ